MAIAASPLSGVAQAFPVTPSEEEAPSLPVGSRAYAALDAATPGQMAALCVLHRMPGQWQAVQQLAAESPQAAVLDQAGRFLYVAQARVGARGLPAGRVEVYGVDPLTGRLHLHGQQRMSLDASRPFAMALSPEGNLLVTASLGGVFSVFPVAADGSLQPVTAARKDLSAGRAGRAMTMGFLKGGNLAVSAGSRQRHFACTAEGLTLLAEDIAMLESTHDDPQFALNGLPGVRCLAVATPTGHHRENSV